MDHFPFAFSPSSTSRRIVPVPRFSAIIYFTVVEEPGAWDAINTLAGE